MAERSIPSYSYESERYRHTRPLGIVSDFVVEQLPDELSNIRQQHSSPQALAWRVEELLALMPSQVFNSILQNSPMRNLAGVDLKMLDTAIVHSGVEPPRTLQTLVDRFSHALNQPTGLTYEEIILINPQSDMRTFTTGNMKKTERAFYEGQRIVEKELDEAVTAAKAGLELIGRSGRQANVAPSLHSVCENMGRVTDETRKMGKLNRRHFLIFRRYLIPNPIRHTDGPSAAFSAGIPILELLTYGEKFDEERKRELEEKFLYFSRQGRVEIENAMMLVNRGQTISLLSRQFGKPENLEQGIFDIRESIRNFRQIHYEIVRKLIPEALEGKIAGTSGENDAGTFLRKRME